MRKFKVPYAPWRKEPLIIFRNRYNLTNYWKKSKRLFIGENSCRKRKKKTLQTAHGFLEGERRGPEIIQLRRTGSSYTKCQYWLTEPVEPERICGPPYHQLSKRSEKKKKRFIAIDCGSIPKDLAASEFFGHVKGSFSTGALNDKAGAFEEEANGGTLFLDEIGNPQLRSAGTIVTCIAGTTYPPNWFYQRNWSRCSVLSAPQMKTWKRGHCKNFSWRFISSYQWIYATDAFLERTSGRHSAVCQLFLDQANHELERTLIGFDAEASEAMQKYPWPGNLRQLKNVVKRATLLAQGEFITTKDLGEEINERKTVCENPEMEETFAPMMKKPKNTGF